MMSYNWSKTMPRYAIVSGEVLYWIGKGDDPIDVVRRCDIEVGNGEADWYDTALDTGIWGCCRVYEIPPGYTNKFLNTLDANSKLPEGFCYITVVESGMKDELEGY